MEPIKYFSYFFTRQDLSPEQQIVQTAHVALKMGVNAREYFEGYVPHISVMLDPDNTYFTVVGVRNKDALSAIQMILEKFEFRYEMFFEPDIGGEPTSIAVYPVSEFDRGPLLAFNLLKV